MRALSSLFGVKRPEKPTASPSPSASQPIRPQVQSKKPSRIFGSMTRKPSASNVQPISTPSLSPPPRNLPALSSSSETSSGSQSLRTPGDDDGLRRSSSKASWTSWLTPKKVAAAAKTDGRDGEWDTPRQAWKSRPPPVLIPPPLRSQTIDETDDDSSSSDDDDSEIVSIASPLATTFSSQSPLLSNSNSNVRARLESGIHSTFSPPPLLHLPGQAIFPRSINKHSSLLLQDSLESRMHKTRLLRRAQGLQLARSEELELLPFHTARLTSPQPSCQLDDQAPWSMFQVRTYSRGLQQWALRPCFEDRLDVWTSDSGTGVVSRGLVSGTALGVAALEISEALDALAGAIVDEADLDCTDPDSRNALSLPHAQNSPPLPSPLRIENNPPAKPSAIRSPVITTEAGMSSGPVVRRGVRFAEDDKDDQVPLGYILRIKKKRAEKAQFLKEERARQAIIEMERAAERRLHDAERMEWEREKKQWEAEKKAMEEEKRKQQYAEEVLLARQRREAARSGFYVPTPVRDTARPQLRESKSNPDRNSSYLHPQRQASDFIPGSGSPYSESPTSSNPPSINGSLNGSGFFSRPESTASANTTLSSMEDVRQKKPASSRRASIIPDYSQQPMVAMPYFPMWGNPYAAAAAHAALYDATVPSFSVSSIAVPESFIFKATQFT
ncbi:hypothetical protein HWV62_3611 [Athelia sp. TMB]|nr:hypothetical protein HWV62_3611 [Athelia sp. TMB]